MANYLDNLVATRLTPATAIQPRLASLFEPIQPRAHTADKGATTTPRSDAPPIFSNTSSVGRAETTPTQDIAVIHSETEPVAGAETMAPTLDAMRLPKSSQRIESADDQVDAPILPIPPSSELENKELDTPQPSRPLIRSDDSHLPSREPASDVASRAHAQPATQTILRQVERLQSPRQALAPDSTTAPTELLARSRDSVGRQAKINDRDLLDASHLRNEIAPALPVLPVPLGSETEKTKPNTLQASSQPILENDSRLNPVDRQTRITYRGSLDAAQPRNEIMPALPATMIVQPNITRHEEPRASEPAQPAPVIRVTIGRIEVRANLPNPATPPPAAPPAPKMSLDDYLRSQHGGNG
jgi:hypothetical protein